MIMPNYVCSVCHEAITRPPFVVTHNSGKQYHSDCIDRMAVAIPLIQQGFAGLASYIKENFPEEVAGEGGVPDMAVRLLVKYKEVRDEGKRKDTNGN